MTAAELTEFAAEVLRRPVRPMEGQAHFYDDVASYEAEFSRRFPGKKAPGGGYFDPKTGELHVSPRGNLLTVLHEAIHKVAEETSPLAKQLLGQYLNEGITEEITRDRFGPRAGSHAYDRNVAFVELLQDRLGVDVVENAILHGDYRAFRETVRTRLGGSEVETLEFMRLVGSVGPQSHDSPALRAAIDLLDGHLEPTDAVPEEAADREPEFSEEPDKVNAPEGGSVTAGQLAVEPAATSTPEPLAASALKAATEYTVEVRDERHISLPGGETARIVVGDAQASASVREAAHQVRAMSAATIGQPAGYERRAWEVLEEAGRKHYMKHIAPTEGIDPVSISPKGKPVRTEWGVTNPRSRGRFTPEGWTVPDVGWAERWPPGGQLDLISIPEVSMVADWEVEGPLAGYALHKKGQFEKYLSAARVRINELAAKGQVASDVQVHIHYISDSAPSNATLDYMERVIRTRSLPNVTIFWGRV
jgi:hypothetical protein